MPRKKMVPKEVVEASILASRLKDCEETFLNEPTIQYEVGQEVQWGAHKKVTITESLHGGKIYKVHIVSTHTNYGKPFDSESDTYACWHDITPLNDMSAPIMSHREDYNLNFSQTSIRSLLHYYYGFGIDMDPPYQRGHVWKAEDKIALIDSIFNNVEIGKFVLIHLPYKPGKEPSYEVLDGKQRITALVEYFENRYAYNGKTFYQLHPRDQSHFEEYSISFARTESPMTQEQKYRYFLKLNIRGVAQDPKHLERVKELLEQERTKKV